MAKAYIPFGAWLPDQPSFANPGSDTVFNVVPKTIESYGPAPDTAPVTSALDHRCQGAVYVRDKAGNVHGFAGTSDKLYTITGSTTWADVSKAGGYSTATDERWVFSIFGERIIATNFADPIQSFVMGVSTKFADLSPAGTLTLTAAANAVGGTAVYTGTITGGGSNAFAGFLVTVAGFTNPANNGSFVSTASTATTITLANAAGVAETHAGTATFASPAPKARYIAQVKDFVMVANTTDGIDGAVPQRVWWPAIDDPTDWPTIGSDAAAEVQSDRQDIVGDGGWDMGIVGGLSAADAVVFQERSLTRVVYVGPPAVFSFTKIADARGTPAPGSIISVGEEVYYLADNGFYKTDGVQSVGVGNGMVDKTFWSMVDTNYLYRISAAVDPVNKLIYWAFPGPQNSGGTPNYIIVLNYDLGRWSLIEQVTEVMLRALSVGYTLDQLDPFGNLETLPFSLDSRAWTGGRLNLACFDTSHKMAIFAGMPLAATIDTSESSLNPKGLAHISRTWPLVDTDQVTVTLGQRNRLADQVAWRTTTPITSTTGSAPARSTAVFQRARVQIPAGTAWNFAQGIQVDATPAGNR